MSRICLTGRLIATAAARLERRKRSARAERLDTPARVPSRSARRFSRDRGLQDPFGQRTSLTAAGYSKGADLLAYFESKTTSSSPLLEDGLEQPIRRMIELLESAPPGSSGDMGSEARRAS